MQALTNSECCEWLKTHSIPATVDGGSPRDGSLTCDCEIVFQVPEDARFQHRLARDLVAWEGEFGSALFWLTDWPFCKPDQMAIVDRLRRGHGEQRNLIDAPGHVFEANEKYELVGWVSLMMGFGWDGWLFSSPYRDSVFQTSHEDFVRLTCDDQKRFAEAQELISEYAVEIHSKTRAT